MKPITTFLLSLITAMAVLVSCTVDIAMKINEDYSGHIDTVIDISAMMDFAAAADSLSPEDMDSVMSSMSFEDELTDSMKMQLEKAGISNIDVGMTMKEMRISYDFADINRAYDFFSIIDSSSGEPTEGAKEVPFFRIEKDRFHLIFSEEGMSGLMNNSALGGGEGDTSGMDMSMMGGMFTIRQSYEFERPVKEVIINDLPVVVEGNKISYEVNLSEYMSKFVGKELTVVFGESTKEGKKTK